MMFVGNGSRCQNRRVKGWHADQTHVEHAVCFQCWMDTGSCWVCTLRTVHPKNCMSMESDLCSCSCLQHSRPPPQPPWATWPLRNSLLSSDLVSNSDKCLIGQCGVVYQAVYRPLAAGMMTFCAART